ncbi:MAG: DUF1351 domain-containing protein [Atopobium sp.]|uniref:DUF1351 domain-containing protein n=1 Tax=Atopobium sp. TaxID=1872650 RepID=UPI002A7ECABB|nr:DUF1351 domain-containing protein [Atopobium sp.]MDY4523081.1 DUF1351 domain-containing protein [Atopobium sp.]
MPRKKVEEVKATVIEDDIAALTDPQKWILSTQQRVAEIVKDYAPHEIVSDKDYRESKRARTQSRKEIKAIQDDATERLSAIKEAVKAFEAAKRDVLLPLTTIDDSYKHHIGVYEALVIDSKLQDVEGAYMDYAPALVELVPFQKLREKYAAEDKWENIGTNVEDIKQSLFARVDRIGQDEKTIEAQQVDAAEKQAMKADYFASLDLGEVLRKSSERLRVAELERQRTEALEREHLEQQRQQAEQVIEEVFAPEPAPVQAPPAPASQAHPWVVLIDSATREQMTQLAAALKQIGVSGSIKSGSLKEVANGNY